MFGKEKFPGQGFDDYKEAMSERARAEYIKSHSEPAGTGQHEEIWYAHDLSKTSPGRAILRRRKELPPQKKISALKMFIVIALGAYIGNKTAQDLPEYSPPPQSGFSNTMPAPLEGRPHVVTTTDAAALDTLVNSLAAEDKAAEAALAQAFLRNYQAGLKMSKQAYEQYGESPMEMGAFYNAMRKNGVTITDKDAVAKALRDEKIVADAFSSENFPSGDEKQLKEFRKAFVDALVGK